MSSIPKLLVIVGETGSGKSALALKIAKEFNGEIISADSWTVYKGFNIGTAKPSAKDMRAVPHHLIDIVEPHKGFNAPKFKKLAMQALKQIQSRGRLPIVVGGTGLYIDSLIFDYGFLASGSLAERKRLDKLSLDELMLESRNKNISLEGLDIKNKRRVVRAIESGGQVPVRKQLMPATAIIGLQVPKEELRDKIEKRVQRMFNQGLQREVQELSNELGWEVEAMKGIGYREFRGYFDGTQTLDDTKARIISSSMNLAKRQRTWLKRNPSIQWYSSPEEAYKEISQHLRLID